MIIYHWTGEYRPPKKGEYYLNHNLAGEPRCARFGDFKHTPYWILRGEEIKQDEEKR